jgi:hypothetical protein
VWNGEDEDQDNDQLFSGTCINQNGLDSSWTTYISRCQIYSSPYRTVLRLKVTFPSHIPYLEKITWHLPCNLPTNHSVNYFSICLEEILSSCRQQLPWKPEKLHFSSCHYNQTEIISTFFSHPHRCKFNLLYLSALLCNHHIWTQKNWALETQIATFRNYISKFRSRLKWCTYSNIPFIWQTRNQTHARLSLSTHTNLSS